MARHPSQTKPQRPIHTAEEKRRDIERLERRIAELEAFDPATVKKRFSSPEVIQRETAIDDTLSAVFGHRTVEYDRYARAAKLDQGPVTMQLGPQFGGRAYHDDGGEARQYVTEGKARSISLLQQAVRGLEEEIELETPAPAPSGKLNVNPPLPASQPRKVFVVHGHDEGAREAVARFLGQIGFQEIILHEQANQGRTVIEKVVAHGDVGFAVVLLTPDDEGCKKGETPKPRARQNVVLELGYFLGRLGRERVCALKRGDVEIPSDFDGVVYEPFDASGGWRQALGRELEAAGFDIDWNKVMRP